MNEPNGTREEQDVCQEAPRPYARPTITDLGTLAELTHNNPSPGFELDGGSTN